LIAQLEQELQPEQAQESQLALAQELAQESQLVLQLVQVLESVPAQVSQPVRVQHPLHQPLQSLFQRQPSHLLQREFLSAFLQLAKVLQYQLCL
jgi:hypothetical protein